MKRILTLLILGLLIQPVQAKHVYLEKDYQDLWAKNHVGSITEYHLDDESRVDIMYQDYAIEVEFAYKVYESIGQSLYYGYKTGKKPAIVFIIEDDSKATKEAYNKLKYLTSRLGIQYWVMTPKDMKGIK